MAKGAKETVAWGLIFRRSSVALCFLSTTSKPNFSKNGTGLWQADPTVA